jgi:hypothetical protein
MNSHPSRRRNINRHFGRATLIEHRLRGILALVKLRASRVLLGVIEGLVDAIVLAPCFV